MEASYVAIALADYAETKIITGDCYEGNPLIGECGERVPAEAYFATMIGLHLLVAHLLPGRARTIWQGVTIGVQGRTVVNNYLAIRHGYRFAF